MLELLHGHHYQDLTETYPVNGGNTYPLMKASNNTSRRFTWFFFFLPYSCLPQKYLNIALMQLCTQKHSLCKSLLQTEANTWNIETRDARQGCKALYKNMSEINVTNIPIIRDPLLPQYIKQRCAIQKALVGHVSGLGNSFFNCGNIQWYNITETGKYYKHTHMFITLFITLNSYPPQYILLCFGPSMVRFTLGF